MKRGELWWASLGDPAGSGPGYRRPVVVVSADEFNRSAIRTVIVAVVTSNLRLGDAPGNFLLSQRSSPLDRDSVINVSQLLTLDKGHLTERIGALQGGQLRQLNEGLRLVLAV